MQRILVRVKTFSWLSYVLEGATRSGRRVMQEFDPAVQNFLFSAVTKGYTAALLWAFMIEYGDRC
jgi:hypothetical protein